MEIINNMEIFKDINKFENKYQISNTGKVRNKKTGLYLKPKYNKKGYQYINLSISKYKSVKWYIHRLVGFHFIPNPKNKPQINHKDGNPSNNNVENLEWCTNEENQRHAVLNNLHFQGEKHKSSKFTNESILLLPKLINIGFNPTYINKLTGVAIQNLDKIFKGKTWRQLNLFPVPPKFKKGPFVNKITMSENLYIECVKHWGNTVLNSMIAKGILSVQSIATE